MAELKKTAKDQRATLIDHGGYSDNLFNQRQLTILWCSYPLTMQRDDRTTQYQKTPTERSFWLEMCPATNFPTLESGVDVDVVVLGGGIAGITTATLLKDAGFNVAVLEADRIVKEVTIGTTAKISAAPNLVYDGLLATFGKTTAQKVARANLSAVEQIADIVRERKIDCDFRRLPLYIYTESEEKTDKIKRECLIAKELGLPVAYTTEVPLPFKTAAAIVYENQAQFHPRKYLLALAENLRGNGSYVFEKTRALTIEPGRKEVVTEHGSITASTVVVATHTPVYDPDHVCDHLSPARSYVVALYARQPFPNGMFVDFDPVHTYRTAPTDEGDMIIVAGEHSPVEVPDKSVFYRRLDAYARRHLDVQSIAHRWSSKDVITDDGLPMIGVTSQPGIYVSTGFGFWGMNNGTVAAMVLTDLITGTPNPFAELFDPLRFL
ncbi:MAG: NAD(P)/FAD-dependent oxidoreductase [Halobacteriota archaeon]